MYPNGEFKGSFDIKISGFGSYFWKNGNKYEGNWKNSEIHGLGQITWPDGRKYQGEWVSN